MSASSWNYRKRQCRKLHKLPGGRVIVQFKETGRTTVAKVKDLIPWLDEHETAFTVTLQYAGSEYWTNARMKRELQTVLEEGWNGCRDFVVTLGAVTQRRWSR